MKTLAGWLVGLAACAACGDVVTAADVAPNDVDAVDGVEGADGVVSVDGVDSVDSVEALPPEVAVSAVFQVSVWEAAPAAGGESTAFATAGRAELRVQGEGPPSATVVRGDCTLIVPGPAPFCDPPCAPGTVCWADPTCSDSACAALGGTCAAPPAPLGAGDIEVRGLAARLTLVPTTVYQYYGAHFDPEPPAGDLFAAGAVLTAHAAGDGVPAFEVATRGVQALATSLACPPPLHAGASLEVRWTPAAQPGDRIRFTLSSGNHATHFVHIRCESDDTGALTVATDLVDRYLAERRPIDLWSLVRVHDGTGQVADIGLVFSAASSVDCRW